MPSPTNKGESNKKQFWQVMVDKVKHKLTSWKGRSLSFVSHFA